MRPFTILIASIFSTATFGQNSIDEIQDLQLKGRVIFVKNRTDSFLLAKIGLTAYKKVLPDFGVTFTMGEFLKNYLFLNKEKISPSDINNLIQYYSVTDKVIKLEETLGIYYDDVVRKEIVFATVVDSLKAVAVKKIYDKRFFAKILDKKKNENLKSPFIKIVVDKKSLTYFIFLKDKESTHNYSID